MVQIEADERLFRVDRWREEEDLDVPLWHKRTAHMIRVLREKLSQRGELDRRIRLLELGCGAMAAEQILASHGLDQIEYLPSDVYPRDHRTLVIDLEQPGFVERVPHVDVIMLGGVLEHLVDPRACCAGWPRAAACCSSATAPGPTGSPTATAGAGRTTSRRNRCSGWPRPSAPVRPSRIASTGPRPTRCGRTSSTSRAKRPDELPLCREDCSVVAHEGEFRLRGRRIVQETRVCEDCGLTFEVASPDQDWAGLYGDVWQRGALPTEGHRELYRNDARRIGPGAGRLVFEIGCGAGLLLDELARLGWRTSGCDPEVAAIEHAREKGHDVEAELFEPREGRQADLVVLGDVLEHQADPRAMLAGLRGSIAPGGRFYVRVPDLERVNFETFGDVFGLQHRVWFTSDTLAEILAVEGFEVRSTGTFRRGLNALADLAPRRDWRRPAGEPERSFEIVRRYSADMRERRARIGARLAGLAGREVALYGGGEHAEELLSFSDLGDIATRVVDGNEALWGKPAGR